MNWLGAWNHVGAAIVATFGAGGIYLVFAAVVRHWCDWPPTPQKLWNWMRDSSQELVSIKSGAQNPTQPKQ